MVVWGCADEGGQSGTDSMNSTGGGYCDQKPRDVAVDTHIGIVQLSGNDLLDIVGGKHEIPGGWLPDEKPVTLTVEIDALDSAHLETGCGPADFGVSAHVFTSDGVIDATATNLHLEPQQPAELLVPLPDLPAELIPENADPDHPAVLSVKFPIQNVDDAQPIEASVTKGAWAQIALFSGEPWTLRPPMPSAYVPSAAVRAACKNAPDYASNPGAYTPLASESEVREKVAGSWVLCQNPFLTNFAGFTVAPNGAVTDLLVEGDAIVSRGGFQHEGNLQVFDTSDMNEAPGLFQIGALNWGGFYYQGALVNSDERGVSVLMPTTATFDSLPNPFASLERAGTAACGTAEAEVATLEDVDTLGSLLLGAWTRCSGSLPNGAEHVTFNGPDVLSFTDAAGRVLDTEKCELIASHMTGGQLSCKNPKTNAATGSYHVSIAKRPLMLRLDTSARQAIFSADP
jgi:hypothetical protein